MAKRLKDLREKEYISHEKLSKYLYKYYDIKISTDSLMNYEVTDENHSKAFKNLGMRAEYLRYLADYFGVSTDYILGRTEDSNVNPPAADELGLPENTAKFFAELASLGPNNNQGFANDVYRILGNDYFEQFLYQTHLFFAASKAEAIYHKIRDQVFDENYTNHTHKSDEELKHDLQNRVQAIVSSGEYGSDINHALQQQFELDISTSPCFSRDVRQISRSIYGNAISKKGSQYVTLSQICKFFVQESLEKLLDDILKE